MNVNWQHTTVLASLSASTLLVVLDADVSQDSMKLAAVVKVCQLLWL